MLIRIIPNESNWSVFILLSNSPNNRTMVKDRSKILMAAKIDKHWILFAPVHQLGEFFCEKTAEVGFYRKHCKNQYGRLKFEFLFIFSLIPS